MEKREIDYQPDSTEAHQEFSVEFHRETGVGKCHDGGHIKIHKKETLEIVSKFLGDLGFKLRIIRTSDVTLLDEMEEEEETAGEGEGE